MHSRATHGAEQSGTAHVTTSLDTVHLRGGQRAGRGGGGGGRRRLENKKGIIFLVVLNEHISVWGCGLYNNARFFH